MKDDAGVTALGRAGPVGQVLVREDADDVHLQFWLDRHDAPRRLRTALTRSVFEHPALQAPRRVLAAVPYGEAEILDELRAHVSNASTRVAGATCLLEGRIRRRSA